MDTPSTPPFHPIGSTHSRFVESLAPVAAALTELADSGHSRGPVVRTPRADSLAMAELNEQPTLAGEWGTRPIEAVQSQVGLLLTAAEDAMRSFAILIVPTDIPLYAHVTLARSGLEFLALANHLGDSTIGPRERVRRSINQKIYEAYQAEQLPVEIRQDPTTRKRLMGAKALGFETSPKKRRVRYLLPERPTTTKNIRDLLDNDDLGASVYNYTSSISHGVMWGLLERLERPHQVDPRRGPVTVPALTHSSDEIATLAMLLMAGHISAYGEYLKWTKIPAEEWSAMRPEIQGRNQATLRRMAGNIVGANGHP